MHQFNSSSRFRPVNVMETLGALLVHSLRLHHWLGVAMNIDVCVVVIYNYYLARLSKCVMPTSTCVFIRFKIDRTIWILIVVWILLTQYAPVNIQWRRSIYVVNWQSWLLKLLLVEAVLLLDHVGHRVACTLPPVKRILVKAVLTLLILVVTWLLLLLWSLLFDPRDVVVQT